MTVLGVNSMAISAPNSVANSTVAAERKSDRAQRDQGDKRTGGGLVRAADLRVGDTAQDAENNEKLKKAALQFEAIFVRQVLRNAQFAPKGSHQGYGSMIVDAMANAITQGGGLGLSKQIEQMVAAAQYDAEQTPSDGSGPAADKD